MDARIRFTKAAIRQAFLELLKNTPLAHITVKEICDKAEINRATFYKYYDNAYDLLDKIELELLEKQQKDILAANSDDLAVTFGIILEDIYANKELYMVLFSENGDTLFREKLFKVCYEKHMKTIETLFPNLSSKKRDWLYYYVAEGSNGILKQWIKNDMREPIADVIDFLNRLIEGTNHSLV